ncbi:flagellar motor protein MotB [Roseicella frigidaeris]|uniref:Flagellar motor protein MotB n=1 Tax=Roseicella frigidaeris TaxID=2230885 RepID=A0A327MBB9_9PROT|nr:flagellar motor protein MotB [Roseicella frigidaeris]RAI59454.1 flagellar motor protein MotB [Roseicella frigidaeris]
MAGKGKGGRDGAPTIVLRREEAGGDGHHGGAWKVAYADFVTAMMAFFLLMWLLNATSDDQRRGLADYFAPANVLGRSATGSGEPFGGTTPNSDGAMVSDNGAIRIEQGRAPVRLDIEDDGPSDAPPETAPPAPPQPAGEAPAQAALARPPQPPGEAAPEVAPPAPHPAGTTPADPPAGAAALGEAALRAELARREAHAFEQAAAEIRAAVREDPALADLGRQLLVEQVPEGLRIQLLDAERQAMFAVGNAAPNERARALLAKVAAVAARLPNGLAIAGHTDASPFRGDARSNWELSAERANAVRRLLLEAGIAEGRLQSVAGHADRMPLLPEAPMAAANRRVAITLLRSTPGTGPGAAPGSGPAAAP